MINRDLIISAVETASERSRQNNFKIVKFELQGSFKEYWCYTSLLLKSSKSMPCRKINFMERNKYINSILLESLPTPVISRVQGDLYLSRYCC